MIAKSQISRFSAILALIAGMACDAAPPVVDYFEAEVDPAQPGHSRILRWHVLGAEQVVIDGGIGDVTARNAIVPLVSASSVWKYLDDGSDQGSAWRAPDFDDSSWSSGAGKLGYGDSDVLTYVGFGPNSGAKFATTYFRRTFEVSGVDELKALTVGLRYDDGAIVYLNGVEIARYNLPPGELTYDTFADLDAVNDGRVFETSAIAGGLVEGRNVLAVEMHQEAGNDSDISFDLRLEALRPSAARVTLSSHKVYRLTASNADGTSTADAVATIAANAACVYPFQETGGIPPLDPTGRTRADLFPVEGMGQPTGDGETLAFEADRALRIAGESLANLGARIGDGMTVGFWIRSNAGPTTVIDAMKLGRGIQLLGDGEAVILRVNGIASNAMAIDGIFDGQWHHVALAMMAGDSITPGVVELFRDGIRVASLPWTSGIWKTPEEWILGGDRSGSGFFAGSLKQFGVFDGALGSADILTMRDEGPSTLAAPRVIGFSPADPTLVAGAMGRLRWQVVNAPERRVTSMPGAGIWNADGLTSLPVVPPQDEIYTLTATGPLGTAAATTGFSLGAPPEIAHFSASPNPIPLGGNGTLDWEVADALQIDILPGVGRVPPEGEAVISPQSRTDYNLVASNRFGTVTEPLSVGTDTDPAPGAWTLAFIPDTQHYVDNLNNVPLYDQFMTWIADHAAKRNIRFAAHVGDIVQNDSELEWNRVMPGINRVLAAVPMGLAPGNHDYQGDGGSRVTQFNRPDRCGPGSAYAAQPTLRGTFQHPGDAPGRHDNSYHTFVANGRRYLVVCLEFGPRDAVVAWADGIVASHPDHHAILVTHAYLFRSNARYDWATFGSSQDSNPHRYGIGSDPAGVNDGEEIWQKLARKHPNVAMVLCGHVQPSPYFMTSTGDAGNPVHQMMFDPQAEANGGNGFVRFLEFQPDGRSVRVKTYSPYYDSLALDAWRTDATNMFDLEIAPLPSPVDADGDRLPDDWESSHGLDPDSADDGTGNPDHDQWHNLWEYIFGLDPNFGDAEAAVAGSMVSISGEDYGAFTYRRRIGLPEGLRPRVEVSEDTRTWQADPGDASLIVPLASIDAGDGTETVTVRLAAPVLLTATRFFRIRVGP